MRDKKQNYFSVLVVGDNAEELMAKYDIHNKVEPYMMYKFKDKDKLYKTEKKIYEELLKRNDIDEIVELRVNKKLNELNSMTSFQYYQSITNGMYYDENGDAWSDKNKDGKYKYYSIGRRFSIPFKLFDDKEVYTCTKEEVNWGAIHMTNKVVYESVWDMLVEGREPTTDEEKLLYENMKNMENYFSTFSNKDEYVAYNTSFFHYAYLDENGWFDMDDAKNDKKWVSEYYDRFITPLKPTDKMTVFECTI